MGRKRGGTHTAARGKRHTCFHFFVNWLCIFRVQRLGVIRSERDPARGGGLVQFEHVCLDLFMCFQDDVSGRCGDVRWRIVRSEMAVGTKRMVHLTSPHRLDTSSGPGPHFTRFIPPIVPPAISDHHIVMTQR